MTRKNQTNHKKPNPSHYCLLQNKLCKNPQESVIDGGNLILILCVYIVFMHTVYVNYSAIKDY